ncbi:MAG: 6,7-dimethyl-8-ribityllumazine synthase [Bacteroidota bacterium]|nr:6,7-dimethyl-8-ribityllumazine synthase [Bacteroidota bacterium]
MAQVSNSNLFGTITGTLPKGACVVMVRTEWNAAIVDKLEAGCRKALLDGGIERIETITVPGAFEIPFGVKQYWEAKKGGAAAPNAFVALGCVLRGGTPHFEYVCQAVTAGISTLNLELPVPVIFGVLTLDTQLQADERTGGIHGHKGEEAGITAIKMIALQHSFGSK